MSDRDFEKLQFLNSLNEEDGLPLPDFVHNPFRFGKPCEAHYIFWDQMDKLAGAAKKPSYALFVAGLVLFWIDRDDVEPPLEMRGGWYEFDREDGEWIIVGAS